MRSHQPGDARTASRNRIARPSLRPSAELSNLRNQLTQSEERLAGIGREEQRLQAEIATASSQSETFGGQRGQIALEFESVSQRASGLAAEIASLRETLETKRSAENDTKKHLDSIRSEYATALGKKGSLEAVIAEHGYSTESVRRLFQSGAMQGGNTPAGVLADFLEVEPRYERVVEDFLRDELNLRRGQVVGRRRRRSASAALRRQRARHIPGASGGLAGQVLVRRG